MNPFKYGCTVGGEFFCPPSETRTGAQKPHPGGPERRHPRRTADHYEIFIRRLTALQLRVLRTLAMRGESGIYSGETLAAAQVYNSASMKRAVEKLIKDNLIYAFDGEYRFANPFFREWLKRN